MPQQIERDGVFLRAARSTDLHAVHELLTATALMLDDVAEHIEDGYVVAFADDRLIGVAGVERYGEHGLLRSVAVDATQRGSGIGATLTRDRIAWARRKRLRTLWLLTEDAAGFFQRQGFERVERASAPAAIATSRQYAVGCPTSSALMRVELTGRT